MIIYVLSWRFLSRKVAKIKISASKNVAALLGGYPVSLLCTVTNTWKTPTRLTKNTCVHLKN